MPFDTTYYIPAGENKLDIVYTVPGGEDTVIHLNKGELPPRIDAVIKKAITTEREPSSGEPASGYFYDKKEDPYAPGPTFIIVFIAIFIFVLLRMRKNIGSNGDVVSDRFTASDLPISNSRANDYNHRLPCLVYYGDELNFSELELRAILIKRFPYFGSLSQIQKTRFLQRLQHFIANKTFKVHDDKGYKEMPVLISAAAIQLTFGLEKYLLPNFKFIHVYPQEFMRVSNTICFLEGNVSGHAINLSWKHFLEGYANPNDGQNVGLHELAHALYYQTFIVEENVDANFRNTFDGFNSYGNKVFEQESLPGNDLYSDYALRNFQEFWAESAEIFFEKPAAMKARYPVLYDTIKTLLNQDPYNKIA